ncbi:MAG: alpha-glucosidase [Candidatus Obscuribacterales bacterium]
MRLRRRFSLAAACLSVLLPVSTWSAIPSAIALPGAAPAEVPAEASMDPQPLPREGAGSAKPWWQRAVFYEIYPRSFADSNGDGIGDINGITSKLDYLKDLGVDALWITPCYPSPQVDFGYDISDYCNIAPEFGTLADFDNLVKEAKKRDIRIIMDLVMNHTSDKHPWFVASKSSAKDSKRDFYIWRDGKNGGPPNNWQSVFGHSAWQLDKTTGQYYYHFFYPEQPDLNWRNPAVKEAMYDVTRFWLDKGVAGFRLDAISTLYEDEKLTDNPTKPGVNNFGDPNMDHKYNDRLPQIHDVLRELRTVMGKYDGDRVVIGETFTADISGLWDMYGKKLDEIQLPMNFFFADVNKLDAQQFQKIIKEVDGNPVQGWPVYLFSNHDQQRAYVRYGDGKHNDQIAKLMATMLLTLRGTPILYYGEEIGMTNRDPISKDEVQDPIGKIGWPKEKGRDGERTPMQWNAEANAGFSTAKQTWVPVADNFKTHNVASERADEQSIYRYYQSLIQLRRKSPALRDGTYEAVEGNPKVVSYLRQAPDQLLLIAVNMSPEEQVVELKPQQRHGRGHSSVLQASWPNAAAPANPDKVSLPPYGSLVLEYKP